MRIITNHVVKYHIDESTPHSQPPIRVPQIMLPYRGRRQLSKAKVDIKVRKFRMNVFETFDHLAAVDNSSDFLNVIRQLFACEYTTAVLIRTFRS